MSKRSNFARFPQDAYSTIDPRAVAALVPYLDGIRFYAEPCCGNGILMNWLAKAGLSSVQCSDIVEGIDALSLTDFGGADAIITNPPWTREILHDLIDHFQKHLPTWLLFDSDWAYTRQAKPYLNTCSDIVAVGRLRWIAGTKQMGKDNVSWYRFWHLRNGGPHFHGRI